ncbi:MAG TPA: hypothetical protein VGP33_07015 [Chloroflexota bacterium]|nr:hypothetical protein [Chloroflexota bacterium]
MEILGRAPVDFSRRASYGSEQRTEHVRLHWAHGRELSLEPSRDDRISFALRDHYEKEQPACREQILRLIAQYGPPEAVTVAWSYEAEWEGEPRRSEAGRQRFTWPELIDVLAPPAPESNC